MFDGAAAVSVLCLAGLFAGFCIAVSNAFFSKRPSRTRFRMAALWAVLLVLAALFDRIASDALGGAGLVNAVVIAAILTAALLLSAVFPRYWESKDVLAAVAYLQMHRKAPPVVRVEDSWEARGVGGGAQETDGRVRDDRATFGAVTIDHAMVCALAAREYELTRREEEILLLLLGGGKSFAAIAGELFISDNTVKTHVRHIYRKMGVNRKEGLSEKVFEAAEGVARFAYASSDASLSECSVPSLVSLRSESPSSPAPQEP